MKRNPQLRQEPGIRFFIRVARFFRGTGRRKNSQMTTAASTANPVLMAVQVISSALPV
jgi:hypothetical protein